MRKTIGPLFRGDRYTTHVYQNAQPVLNQSALMLSDSFGDLSAEVFAGGFRTLIHVNLNDLQAASPSQLIEHVRRAESIDRVIFLIQEGNAQLLAAWR